MAMFFSFELDDGTTKFLTIEEARELKSPKLDARIEKIARNSRSIRRTHDGFQPGYQGNLNETHHTYGSYRQRCKELGLVEVGYDDTPRQKAVDFNPFASDEAIKAIADDDKTMSDTELDALKDGNLLKDVKIEDDPNHPESH